MSRKERLVWDLLGIALAGTALWATFQHMEVISNVLLVCCFIPLLVRRTAR
jgi:hypothetical protein